MTRSPLASVITDDMIKSQMSMFPKIPGIVQPAGGITKTLTRLGAAPPLSGPGARAMNVAGALHEGFERQVKKKNFAPSFGHLAPSVIAKETNLLNRMTGPGSDEAREAFRRVRGLAETPAMEDMVRRHYGQRGVDYVRQHGYTAAMRRDLDAKARARGHWMTDNNVEMMKRMIKMQG
jgi:hypothetical protein